MHDKVLGSILGKPTFLYSLEAFLASETVQNIVVVYRDDSQRQVLAAALSPSRLASIHFSWVQGGERRQDSVVNGLQALPYQTRYVFVHDAARPLIQPECLQALKQKVQQVKAVALAHPLVDTIVQTKGSDAKDSLCTLETLPRQRLWAMETPQVFERSLIHHAYNAVDRDQVTVSDDASALSYIGGKVSLLVNPSLNPKLTFPQDIRLVEALLRMR